MPETTWSREQVEQMLREDDFSYQDIALPYGLSTGGVDRSATARAIFPDDMSGKSVLDLGAKFGYFCFEALRRGADRVVGVDVAPDSIRKARLLADCLGYKATFEQLDVESDPIEERFDYVLCLNLLHHLKNPIATLDKLIGITRERLVLEVAALGRHDRRKVGVSPIGNLLLNRYPVMFVSENGTGGKRSVQKFFITSSALENLLFHHRRMFARVDTLRSEHKDRYIAVAHRRRVDRLVVVAGPTSAGKSTLIDELRAGRQPALAERAGIEDPAGWAWGDSKALKKLTEPHLERLIFHYDFLRPHLRSAKTHDRDEALDLLDTARDVTFVTIWCPPEALLAQLQRGEIDRKTTLGVYWGRKRHLQLREEYRDPARIRAHYRAWFDFTRRRPGEHLVVSPSEGMRVQSIAEWEAMTRPLEGGG